MRAARITQGPLFRPLRASSLTGRTRASPSCICSRRSRMIRRRRSWLPDTPGVLISIRDENVREWLATERETEERLEQILSERVAPYYEHRIAA